MSDPSDTVEDMFDGSLPEAADLSALSDAELVAASAGWGRVEAAAAARKLAAMAEIFCRRTDIDDPDERENWFIDPETSLLNDLAGAHNIRVRVWSARADHLVTARNKPPPF